jgi:hypothetical protein
MKSLLARELIAHAPDGQTLLLVRRIARFAADGGILFPARIGGDVLGDLGGGAPLAVELQFAALPASASTARLRRAARSSG